MSVPTVTPAANAAMSASDNSKVKAPSVLLRFATWLSDTFSRPQPVGRHLRRRDRAVRHYRHQQRGRIRLHRTMVTVGILISIICLVLTLVFFNTDLIRPHLAPDTSFAGITVLTALFGIVIAAHAGYQLYGINAEARRFAEFYLNATNEDGTISIDPASDHDYGDRVVDGRVFVRMVEIYDWFCGQN